MEEMYKTVSKVALSNDVKEKIRKNKEDAINKELYNRIKKCEETLNKNLVNKFYKITNKVWTRIANKKMFYIDSEVVDESNKNIKLLIADSTKITVNSNNSTDEIEGCKYRLLNKSEAEFIFNKNILDIK